MRDPNPKVWQLVLGNLLLINAFMAVAAGREEVLWLHKAMHFGLALMILALRDVVLAPKKDGQ